MKKRILAMLLAILMVFPMALTLFAEDGSAGNTSAVEQYYYQLSWRSDADKLATMTLKAKSPNGNMLLYMDEKSGEMAIKNLKTGKIIFTNPYDVKDSNLLDREKPYALSQIDINYTIISSGEIRTFHSYNDCFAYGEGNREILSIDNGVKVNYTFGDLNKDSIIPFKIKAKDLEAVLERAKPNMIKKYMEPKIREEYKIQIEEGTITDEELQAIILERAEKQFETDRFNILVGCYIPFFGQKTEGVDLSKYTEKDANGNEVSIFPEFFLERITKNYIIEENAQRNALEYPICKTTPIYVIQNSNAKYETLERYLGYAGYTLEEKYADYQKVEEKGIDNFTSTDKPVFHVSASFVVTNEGLVATVDASTITSNDPTKYTVNSVAILPYFNSAHAAKDVANGGQNRVTVYDKGYTFIPDGSGALVRFEDLFVNNNKQVAFENSMYGNDYAYYQIKSKNAANMTMPVFGLSNETDKNGFLAVIEEGDSLAVINSNHSTAYHSIYASFKISPSDVYDLADSFSGGSSSSNKIGIRADRIYNGECKVNYMLLTDDEVAAEYGITDYFENTYVGMAKCYRQYLQDAGKISKIPESQINKDYVKLFLETFGSIEVEEKIATFPVTVDKELTTFEDIKTIYQELFAPKDKNGKLDTANKIGNISFILKGFNNGGLLAEYPTYIEWQDVLGGEDGFNDLLNYAKENKFDVIPDIEFSYAYAGSSNGYSHDENGVRTLDNRYTTKRIYYAATQTFERTGGVAVSTASFGYLYDLFYEDMSKFDVTYLSVRSLGSDLNSDFDKEDYYHREASKNCVVEMLKLLTGASGNRAFKLVIDAGNSYAMPYADAVLAVSLDSSRRSEMSESVPFFGIVYHGSLEFTGDAYNMEGDTEYALLKAIENGATLYFTIAKQNVELLKFEPEYNKYYSVSYDNLKEDIVATYKRFNSVMKDVQDKYIEKHGFLDAIRTSDGSSVDSSLVVMVEYEGGIGFVLNYSTDEIEVTMPNGETVTIGKFDFEKYTK